MIRTAKEVLAIAQREAPGLTEAGFAEQAREHLNSGRLHALAYACRIEQGWNPRDQGSTRYVAEGDQRQRIDATEWLDLALCPEQATAQIWGHDRSPAWTRNAGDGRPVWDDGLFGGAPIYTEVVLADEAGDFGGLWKAPPKAPAPPRDLWSTEQLRDWVAEQVAKAGGEHIDVRTQNKLIQTIRAHVPTSGDKAIRDQFAEMQGKRPAGRPRENV